MGHKWWDRDPQDMTVLERVHAPISVSKINSFRFNRPRAYQYYDTPDGQDCWKKMWVVTKWGFGTGAFLGLIDLVMYSKPPTVLLKLNRFAYYTVPFTGMFLTFGAVTYAATSLRGKDDQLNSAIGGALAGSIAGVWMKNGQIGAFASLFVALFCAARKHANNVGYVPYNPAILSRMERNESPIHDFTLTPVGNKGWTTGAE